MYGNKYRYITLKNKRLAFTLGLLAISMPAYLSTKYPILHRMWLAFFLGCFAIVMYNLITHITKEDLSVVIFLFLLYVCLLISTVLSHGLVSNALWKFLYRSYAIAFTLLCIKKDKWLFIKCFRDVIFVLIALNMISIILYPNGLYYVRWLNGHQDWRYWFLGFKNSNEKFTLMAIMLSGIYFNYTNRLRDKSILYATILISFASARAVKSTGGLVTSLLMSICVIIVTHKKGNKATLFRMRNYSIAVLALFVLSVLTDILLFNETVRHLLTDIIGEGTSVYTRVRIWRSVLNIVTSSPILGIGTQGSQYNASLIGVTQNTVDAHNFYLEILLEGGIIAFIVMTLMFLKMTLSLDRTRAEKSTRILAFGLFTLMALFLVENTGNHLLWIFFAMCLIPDNLISCPRQFSYR